MTRARSGAALLLIALVTGCGSTMSTSTSGGTSTTGASPSPSLAAATTGPSVSSDPSQAPGRSGATDATAYVIATFRPDRLPMMASIQGTLTVGPHGCLVVEETVVVWPRGHTAHRISGGRVEVRDQDGDVVARTGSTLSSGGGNVELSTPLTCERGSGGHEGFLLQGLEPFQG